MGFILNTQYSLSHKMFQYFLWNSLFTRFSYDPTPFSDLIYNTRLWTRPQWGERISREDEPLAVHVNTLSQLSQDESRNFLPIGLPPSILLCELEHHPASGPQTRFCLYNFHPQITKQATLSIRNNLLCSTSCIYEIMYICSYLKPFQQNPKCSFVTEWSPTCAWLRFRPETSAEGSFVKRPSARYCIVCLKSPSL